MGISLTSGTVLAIASTYAAAVNMTAITNAAEAVATLAAGHGVVAGDYLEVTSGWGRLSGRIVRAKTVSTNDVTFEGINTTSTTSYPAASGTGTVRRITGWTNMSQVKGMNPSGGDLQFTDITAVDDVIGKQMPTIRTPVVLNLEVFDDPSLAWYAVAAAANDARTPVAFRMSLPSGSKLVGNAYWGVALIPTLETNAPVRTNIALSFAAEPTRYAT